MSTLLNPFMSYPAAGGGSFDPLSISWGVAYSADEEAANYTDGQQLSTLTDQSGNGNTATSNATNAASRTFDAAHASFNGQPVFDLATLTGDAFTASYSVSQGFSMVAVARVPVDISNTNQAVVWSGTTIPLARRRSSSDASMPWYCYAGSNVVTTESADTDAHVFVGYYDGSSTYLRVDGTEYTGNPGTGGISGLTLGNYVEGQIAFVGLKSGTLSSTEIADLESWADSHYGITVA